LKSLRRKRSLYRHYKPRLTWERKNKRSNVSKQTWKENSTSITNSIKAAQPNMRSLHRKRWLYKHYRPISTWERKSKRYATFIATAARAAVEPSALPFHQLATLFLPASSTSLPAPF